jgi:hypothetical protein
MDKQKIIVVILSIINLIWFIFSLYTISDLVSGFIMLFPLVIGVIIFFILKKIRNFETIRALKYANLTSIIPIGIIIVVYFLFFRIISQPLAGSIVDPVHEQCYQTCTNITKEITNATNDCIQNCMQRILKIIE